MVRTYDKINKDKNKKRAEEEKLSRRHKNSNVSLEKIVVDKSRFSRIVSISSIKTDITPSVEYWNKSDIIVGQNK